MNAKHSPAGPRRGIVVNNRKLRNNSYRDHYITNPNNPFLKASHSNWQDIFVLVDFPNLGNWMTPVFISLFYNSLFHGFLNHQSGDYENMNRLLPNFQTSWWFFTNPSETPRIEVKPQGSRWKHEVSRVPHDIVTILVFMLNHCSPWTLGSHHHSNFLEVTPSL